MFFATVFFVLFCVVSCIGRYESLGSEVNCTNDAILVLQVLYVGKWKHTCLMTCRHWLVIGGGMVRLTLLNENIIASFRSRFKLLL